MESTLFTLGRHLLSEFYDCDPNILNNVTLIEQVMTEAARVAGATIVQQNFHHFSPYGVSGVVVIAESHLAIHTWPEYGYAAIDLFTCGDSVDPMVSYDYLKTHLHAKIAFYSELRRGLLNKDGGQVLKAPFLQMAAVMDEEGQSAPLFLSGMSAQKPGEVPVG
jgi:S-adenosylmethionine decarboxylase proenzyme